MFAKASGHLMRFGARARIVRSSSRVAWNLSDGSIAGVYPASVDLLFIDGEHDSSHVKADFMSWSRLVRPGGIISGHDIFNPVCDGVTDAVLEVLSSREQSMPLHFAGDHTFWWRA
eukprot:gnl/TRDRNA2_/TRDRNA2_54412_c0_seq1.p2 gnl/TRDRNA2_/TRDRNA2_54412_c0~~gnl/TRDRNA2_/TRDRNA2_54412_c0_seq1.p2  ORF type:complete len:116 (+),score=15.31 gnl/TRDRNA2_/TRDRNA2_54412_c0_seq1:1-348(+)